MGVGVGCWWPGFPGRREWAQLFGGDARLISAMKEGLWSLVRRVVQTGMGAAGEHRPEGRPPSHSGQFEPVLISGRPFDLSGCAFRARIRGCRVARPPRDRCCRSSTGGVGMRTVALDVHKRFAEVAVHEDGGACGGWGGSRPPQLRAFAVSSGPRSRGVGVDGDDVGDRRAARRACGSGDGVNPMRTRAIASAKVKTDKIDAKVLAQLGAADFLPEVGRRMRPRARCGAGSRTVQPGAPAHAVAQPDPCRVDAHLIEAPVTDVFGQGGRRWLAEFALPGHEREAVEATCACTTRWTARSSSSSAAWPSRRSPIPGCGG